MRRLNCEIIDSNFDEKFDLKTIGWLGTLEGFLKKISTKEN